VSPSGRASRPTPPGPGSRTRNGCVPSPRHIIYIFNCHIVSSMRVEAGLYREPGEHPFRTAMRVPPARARGRPRAEYRPRIVSPQDVEQLRRHRVPAFLLTPEWVTECGYPVHFRPWLAVPEELASKVSSDYRILPVKDGEALRSPGVVELVTLLLRFDPLAARVVAVRNRRRVDPHELYRRIRNEGLERNATKVRMQEFAPALPVVGTALPRDELRWVERNNPARERPE
jgi:hypothetical protein